MNSRIFKRRLINTPYEFELDLAPLLAVMVKLVPVLLISSAFVQVMMIETDLPQVVKEAIKKQDESTKAANVQIEINKKEGIQVLITKEETQKIEKIPLTTKGEFDFVQFHQKLVKIKTEYPEVFRIELIPGEEVSYDEIVKIMDESRKARDKNTVFPIWDSKENKETETNYMFPDVVFANIIEG